jgi:hypothetical protein
MTGAGGHATRQSVVICSLALAVGVGCWGEVWVILAGDDGLTQWACSHRNLAMGHDQHIRA